MQKIGILYICTGKYKIFWKSFFESCEKYFLPDSEYEKYYFVFTDTDRIAYEELDRVNRIHQEPLKWPYITLLRFEIFSRAIAWYEEMDYLYFFNANMLFLEKIGEEILPSDGKELVFVKHPGFFNKSISEFTYERDPASRAFIAEGEGEAYFMGGLNGGFRSAYLEMVETLRKNVELDLDDGIVALWHDESHLNRYALDHSSIIKILEPAYGYPEGWKLPFRAKILIRDKNRYGGHGFLRNSLPWYKKIWRRLVHDRY